MFWGLAECFLWKIDFGEACKIANKQHSYNVICIINSGNDTWGSVRYCPTSPHNLHKGQCVIARPLVRDNYILNSPVVRQYRSDRHRKVNVSCRQSETWHTLPSYFETCQAVKHRHSPDIILKIVHEWELYLHMYRSYYVTTCCQCLVSLPHFRLMTMHAFTLALTVLQQFFYVRTLLGTQRSTFD